MKEHSFEKQIVILAEKISSYVEARYTGLSRRQTEATALQDSDAVLAKTPDISAMPVLFSIQDTAEPLDAALREAGCGGDAVRALGYLSRTREKTFSEQLFAYIDALGMDNAAVYKAADIDRRLFSKIQSDRNYKPSKDTCIALALALKLEEEKAKDLLSRAGFALSHSSRRDLIIEFFLREGKFDLQTVNGVLEKLGEKPLGKSDYGK